MLLTEETDAAYREFMEAWQNRALRWSGTSTKADALAKALEALGPETGWSRDERAALSDRGLSLKAFRRSLNILREIARRHGKSLITTKRGPVTAVERVFIGATVARVLEEYDVRPTKGRDGLFSQALAVILDAVGLPLPEDLFPVLQDALAAKAQGFGKDPRAAKGFLAGKAFNPSACSDPSAAAEQLARHLRKWGNDVQVVADGDGGMAVTGKDLPRFVFRSLAASPPTR